MGELEKPSIWRLEWSEDPEHHVVLLSVTEKEKSTFYQEVAGRVREIGWARMLLFSCTATT